MWRVLPIGTIARGQSHAGFAGPNPKEPAMSARPSTAAVIDRQLPSTAPVAGVFAPYRLGDLALKNRLVMAPMTRSRAVDGNVPHALAATYYAQRASAGLIVTEASQ